MSGVAIVSVKQAFREIKSYDLDGWENIYRVYIGGVYIGGQIFILDKRILGIYRGSNLYT